MIDLLCCFWQPDHPIRLNREFHLDLQWWVQFVSSGNGVSFWLYPGLTPDLDLEVTSDTASSLGFGAFFCGEWFSGPWLPIQRHEFIAYKELFPVVIAAHLWGPRWAKRNILFHSDNTAVVSVLNSRTSKVPQLMHLMCSLLMASARFNFFTARHIPGMRNSIADALSRFNWQEFRRLAPQAHPFPVPIPHQLLKDLTSPN